MSPDVASTKVFHSIPIELKFLTKKFYKFLVVMEIFLEAS